MADNKLPPPVTPNKGRILKPLNPSDFSTPAGDTVSCYTSFEGFIADPQTAVKYNTIDLQLAKLIPLDAFLLGLGVPEESLRAEDPAISSVASSKEVLKRRDEYCAKVTGEVHRYRTFCDYSNYIISNFETKRILFARNDPRLLEGLTALSLKPDVVAIGSDRPDVVNGQWRGFSARGPIKNQVSWVWKDVNIVVEFKKHHEVIECKKTNVKWTLHPVSHMADEKKVSVGQHRETDSRDHDIAATVPQSKSGSRDGGAIGVPAGPMIPVPPMSTSMSVATSISEGRKRMIEEDDERDIASLKRLRLRPSRTKPIMRFDLIVDGAKYAMEQLSFVPNRRHALEFLILDGVLFLAYYDRSGPVYSYPFHFAQDIYRFVLLMKRLAEMNSWEMGFLENLEEAKIPATDIVEELLSQVKKDSPTSSLDSATGDVPADILQAINAIKSGEHLFTLKIDMILVYLISEIGGRRPYGLVSRGTAVYLSYYPEKRALVAVKISWPAARRLSEVEILKKARAVLRKVDADPNVKRKYGDRKLEDSLPFVIGQKDIDDLKKELSFRWMTQEFYTNFDEAWNRICRVIIMELLRPLFSVTDLDQFKEAIRDIVLAHHFLFNSEARILHRDISLHNLMVRSNGPDRVHGVLIDFDLASLGLPTPEGHLGRRTGTRPYMSVELLREETPLHLERFDWESFFYVICWIASHYSAGDAVKTDAFNEWDEPDDKKLRSIKTELLFGHSEPNLDSLFTDFYKPLILSWMDDFQSMFLFADQTRKKFERIKAANPEDDSLVFDEETLGGHVTWEKFWGIIKQ
ncbi:hypothetical protein ACEPAG_8259 [Sanghuangporus baumii]